MGDGGAKAEELSAYAYERFMKVFGGLCRSEAENTELSDLFKSIYRRWGYHGCDLVSAFPEKYDNFDFPHLKRAIYVFVNSSSGNIQFAGEEFWWLMGLGSDTDLLAVQDHFEALCGRMQEKGLDQCKTFAAEIRGRIKAVV